MSALVALTLFLFACVSVLLANYLGNPDFYLVEMLTPRKPSVPRAPLPPMTSRTWLGFLVLFASLGVGGYAVFLSGRRNYR